MNVNDFTVAFDCDGTLLHEEPELKDRPRYLVIDFFHILESLGLRMVIWSGNGVAHAEAVKDYLGLDAEVLEKGSIKPDLAVDNEDVTLGKFNINVDKGNEDLKICFDIHGTLLYNGDPDYTDEEGVPLDGTPRFNIVHLYETFANFGCDVYIWTSHGEEEAKKWKSLLGLPGTAKAKEEGFADICVDNKDFHLGKIAIPV